jgi:hypothetical protein
MKDQTIATDLDDFLGETGKKRLPKWAKWVIGAGRSGRCSQWA